MKVVHLAGLFPIVEQICSLERALGMESVHLTESTPEHFLEIDPIVWSEDSKNRLLAEKANIVVFHRGESVGLPLNPCSPVLRETLHALRSQGARIILYSYFRDPLIDPQFRNALGFDGTFISSHFDCIFCGSLEASGFHTEEIECLWLAPPIAPYSPPKQYDKMTSLIRVLHVPFATTTTETDQIREAFKKFEQVRAGSSAEIKVPESLPGYDAFLRELREYDVYVERLEGESYGFLGLLAMSCGLTILSKNSPAGKILWPALEFSPVLDTGADNLGKRLESLLLEPRSMRDFSKRTLNFLKSTHDPEKFKGLLQQTYVRLSSKN